MRINNLLNKLKRSELFLNTISNSTSFSAVDIKMKLIYLLHKY